MASRRDDDPITANSSSSSSCSSSSSMITPVSQIPDANSDYQQQQYWDRRFTEEAEYEWLVDYQRLRPFLLELLSDSPTNPSSPSCPSSPTCRLLVIGCGNSSLSSSLYSDGYHSIVNVDFSAVVIEKQQQRFPSSLYPGLLWRVGDVRRLTQLFPSQSFDVIIDKCCMDALTVDEGDVWNPQLSCLASVDQLCRSAIEVLVVGGKYIQISFTQPHFRIPYLSAIRHSYPWQLQLPVTVIGEGVLKSYLYICTILESTVKQRSEEKFNQDEGIDEIENDDKDDETESRTAELTAVQLISDDEDSVLSMLNWEI